MNKLRQLYSLATLSFVLIATTAQADDEKNRLALVTAQAMYEMINFPKQETPSNFVFASDPQYPWDKATDNGEKPSEAKVIANSKQLLTEQYSSIANFRKHHGGYVTPVMINGDMTAFGHGWQRAFIYPLLKQHLKDNYYFGLGNHDYANNVDDCAQNGCARDSIFDLIKQFDHVHYKDLSTQEAFQYSGYKGSLAYSKSFGDVHLIQLNNEPTYSVKINSVKRPTFYQYDFNITDSLDWLERDLIRATADNKIIIVNMHKPYGWEGEPALHGRFSQLMETYPVTAIFAGHIHHLKGRITRDIPALGGVPVFLSGSASQRTYLTARLDDNAQSLIISLVENNDWQSKNDIEVVKVRRNRP
ncbi:MAG: metallophosphoesterase family protein [Pseudomonas sp.]